MSIDYTRPARTEQTPQRGVWDGEIVYLHQPPARVPSPRYSAKDILGVYGQTPRFKGGLKAYARNQKLINQYRVWRAQYRKA